MKTKLTIAAFICAILMSCEKNNDVNKTQPGDGFEIYLTEKPYSANLETDYSTIDFDTISLSEEPILRYDDLISYDTATHKLTLGISHDSLKIGDTGVYGKMFVVTVDKKPIYCGFKWTIVSSVPCNWIFIAEPYKELDNLNDNEIVLSYSNEQSKDPRLDKTILDRLVKYGKIK
jgi:hypothetical protein